MGRDLITLTGHDSQVNSVAYNPGGKRIMTARNDNTFGVYTTNMDELLTIDESRITRQLTMIGLETYGSLLE